MKIVKTKLEGVLIIEPDVFIDKRGFFKEIYNSGSLLNNNIQVEFIQDNMSRSSKGVLRGLHYQESNPQGKLVTCLSGAVFDVAVDINRESKTYGEYVSINLTEENHKMMWIPPGYAHGFCVLSETADFFYKCTEHYDKEDEKGILWNDPELNINWPTIDLTLSDRDRANPTLSELK